MFKKSTYSMCSCLRLICNTTWLIKKCLMFERNQVLFCKIGWSAFNMSVRLSVMRLRPNALNDHPIKLGVTYPVPRLNTELKYPSVCFPCEKYDGYYSSRFEFFGQMTDISVHSRMFLSPWIVLKRLNNSISSRYTSKTTEVNRIGGKRLASLIKYN